MQHKCKNWRVKKVQKLILIKIFLKYYIMNWRRITNQHEHGLINYLSIIFKIWTELSITNPILQSSNQHMIILYYFINHTLLINQISHIYNKHCKYKVTMGHNTYELISNRNPTTLPRIKFLLLVSSFKNANIITTFFRQVWATTWQIRAMLRS